MEAKRFNEGKPELSQVLWFRRGLEALAEHMRLGRQKYPDVGGKPNFMLGGKPDQEYLDSATRHLMSLVEGEEYDKETGTMHAAAVAWNMLALVTLNRADTPVSNTEESTVWQRFVDMRGDINA